MNRNIVKLFFVVITVLLSFFTFLSTRYEYSTMSGISVLLSLFFAIPIIMHSKMNIIKNKKLKLIYRIIMYVLYFVSFLIVLSLALDMVINQTNIFLTFDNLKEKFSNLLFMTTSWLILFYSFTGFEEKESKTNFVLNIIVMVVIILVHLNYFINPNLQTIISETTIGEKALYITQNYIYFGLMYVLLIINRFIKIV